MRPNAFDLAFESRLRELLKPAARFFCESFLFPIRPSTFKLLLQNFDVSYAVLMALLDFPALSIAKYFYGIRRQVGSGPMKRHYKYWALIVLTGPPLIKALLDKKFQELNGGEDMQRIEPARRKERFERKQREMLAALHQSQLSAWHKSLLRLQLSFRNALFYGYPTAHALAYLVMIAYRVAFIVGKTSFWSPWLHLLRTRYSRMTPFHERLINFRHRKSRWLLAWLFSGLRTLVPLLFFLLRFLDWWYSSAAAERLRQSSTDSTSAASDGGIPPPYHADGSNQNTCRLCKRQPCQEPSILKQSGYLFCYQCISGFLQQHRKCPISGISIDPAECESSSIRKIFDAVK